MPHLWDRGHSLGTDCGRAAVGQIPAEPSTRPVGARYEKGAFNNRDNDVALASVEKYVEFCEARSVTPAQMALAWCLAQPGVTSPIIGPRTTEQMTDYLAAQEIVITEEDTKQLDAIFPPGTHVSDYYRADFGPNARWM